MTNQKNKEFFLNEKSANTSYRVNITYADSAGFETTLTSQPTNSINAVNDGSASSLNLTGEFKEGGKISAPSISGDPDGVEDSTSNITYQWQEKINSLWTDLSGENESSLTLGTKDRGKVYRVKQTYVDAQGFSETVISLESQK